MKKILSMLLAVALCCSLLPTASATSKDYTNSALISLDVGESCIFYQDEEHTLYIRCESVKESIPDRDIDLHYVPNSDRFDHCEFIIYETLLGGFTRDLIRIDATLHWHKNGKKSFISSLTMAYTIYDDNYSIKDNTDGDSFNYTSPLNHIKSVDVFRGKVRIKTVTANGALFFNSDETSVTSGFFMVARDHV